MSVPKKWSWARLDFYALFLTTALAFLTPNSARANSYLAGLHKNVGIGVTYYQYHQSTLGEPVRQFYVTAKGSLTYVPLYSRFEFSASAFGSIYQIKHFPISQKTADILGWNGRVGIRTLGSRETPNGFYFTLSAGFYQIQTTVSGNIYGIKKLAGPQGVLSVHNKFKKRPASFSAYIKYAPIGSSITTVLKPSNMLNNREIAGGVSFFISHYMHRPPAYLNIDYSNLNIRIANIPSITARSISTSISIGF